MKSAFFYVQNIENVLILILLCFYYFVSFINNGLNSIINAIYKI